MSAREVLSQVMVSAAVMLVTVGVYDVSVRQPRTPRLAVVDVAHLYGLAQQQAERNVLAGLQAAASSPAAAGEAGSAIANLVRGPEDFGPALSKECRCTLVAMAAVFGADSTVPDFTSEAAQRMGLAVIQRRSVGGGADPAPREAGR